ncbi:hypothetical protein CDD80_5223 [Ophiocordyceps camponoti-rufipedis]|uniref:Uncharacterized protein n=1 Tax=Ophiocordyceps camponoti-rufipedis TaxID=2004952 RepID=A0A2C5YRX8_9HYPO|nr:hypothetical protein CDD80_5223 [Ophiocordyceps camponoti-rufipedis]
MTRRESLAELRAANPDLALTGNIISVTFDLPHALRYCEGGDWELKPRRGQSALFDALAYLSSDATAWSHTVVAWTGEIDIPSDGLRVSREARKRLEQKLARGGNIRAVPVWLADDDDDDDERNDDDDEDDAIRLRDQSRWRRYAQHDLFALLHYQQNEPTDGRRERVQWADYYRMNQIFADRVLQVYRPGDIVIVHDYPLMLLPSMLRRRAPAMHMTFFLHSPFPSSEFVRCLPRRQEVLEGVLGANLVGFQSYSYSRHFLSCCTRILGFPSDTLGVDAYGARVQVGVFPVGIDTAKVEALAWREPVGAKLQALRALYAGKKIIVGRDRLDSVRGVAQKLQAFERFLELYPAWRQRVVLIQLTSPADSSGDGDSRVNELVVRINGQYGSLDFAPVQHYPHYLSQDEYFALLRAADIGLITSVRDGMNTMSFEFVVCQKQGRGPLMLSEFSGSATSLGDAIHINPWDLTGVADGIHSALTMADEARTEMHDRLYGHVCRHDAQSWMTRLIRKACSVLAEATIATTPPLDRALLLGRYRAARGRRLFMLDYDGTLTPIVREPSAAIPSQRVVEALRLLAADSRNAVWIISGRDQDFLGRHLGHIPRLGFSAEHGSFVRQPGEDRWSNLAEKLDMGWQTDVMAVFQMYTDKVPGSFIERKRCALTWHYRLAEPDLGPEMARQCQAELEAGVGRRWEVEVMPGKANIEVRPTVVNKGEIAKRLVATYRESDGLDFALCMGDDFTDEDMFRTLNGASGADGVFTVTVGAGTKPTLARWHLLEPEDVIDCVALLAAELETGHEHMGGVNLAALSVVEGHIPQA